ncbi:hypothetical protein CONPUDRAFT_167968, partial [Coniophora puteana RWD-64-598 SS2]
MPSPTTAPRSSSESSTILPRSTRPSVARMRRAPSARATTPHSTLTTTRLAQSVCLWSYLLCQPKRPITKSFLMHDPKPNAQNSGWARLYF